MGQTLQKREHKPIAKLIPRFGSSRLPITVLGLIIVFFSIVRFHLRNMPLERDEGEYAYVGQLMLQGIPPYQLAYNMKLPGTYAAYALMMALFGQTAAGIHLGLLVVNAVTVILVFFLVKRLFGELAGIISAGTYALLSTSEAVLGLQAHASHFVVLSALGGILVLLKAMDKQKMPLYFLAGFLLGFAFVAKQPGLAFTAFGVFYLVASEGRHKNWGAVAKHLATYSAGAALPFALTCLVLFVAGDLGRMWFWTVSYASQYASVNTLWNSSLNLFVMGSQVMEPYFLVWILAALGVAAVIWDPSTWKHAWFLAGLLFFSWGAVCAGFYFRPHYFILILPLASILVGVAVSSATHEVRRLSPKLWLAGLPAAVFLVVLIVSVVGQSDLLFRLDPIAVCRRVYGNNPFPEAIPIARYINRQTQEGARIAVLGSEPEIYFYARRHSATGYIYTYPFFEPQAYALEMQKEMIAEIEGNHPEYMVFVAVSTSWQMRPGSNTFILDWFQKYAAAHYKLVGVADETQPETRYIWGDAAGTYRVQSDDYLKIFERNDE